MKVNFSEIAPSLCSSSCTPVKMLKTYDVLLAGTDKTAYITSTSRVLSGPL